ncbi:flagellar basal body-associated FliL family protein [Microvirga sp. CF3016]|uniref:flagellar basal body-associated FliL family protein n=1 Tax=Microvirga sp. CF3016 TaxID=3110181 RepID=UPI002E7A14F5|nr:flagellar basal body-associated FliL family protein [Microvirga sp. CF3016]MEE1612593.1 flagellar basal body-associated FliL family protein [Microvirga sp. CF3016]
MAKALELPAPSGSTPSKEGSLRWLLTLGLLTLLSAAIGGGFGLVMVSGIQKQVEEKYKALPQKPEVVSPYTGNIAVKKLAPVVTNLAGSESDWVRVEASIVYKPSGEQNPDVLVSEIRQDILSYIRTMSLAQIQGPSGLLHLREDLNERARLRSKGVIQELVLETLIVQ